MRKKYYCTLTHITFYFIWQDLASQIKKIATFLGRTYSEKFYQDIADACQIDRMRTKKVESVPDDIKVITAAGYDIFYRKGEWRVYQTTSRSPLPRGTIYSAER